MAALSASTTYFFISFSKPDQSSPDNRLPNIMPTPIGQVCRLCIELLVLETNVAAS